MPRTLPTVAIVVLLAAPSVAPAVEVLKLKPTDVLYGDDKNVGLSEPQGVGCGADAVVVADSGNGRLVVYSFTGKTLHATRTVARPEVPFPIRAAILPSGEILALDGRSRRIARIDAAGELGGWLEPSGGPAVVALRSFTVDDAGRVWLLDVGAAQVTVLDPSGRVERTIAFAADAGFPADLAVDGRGDLFVVDAVRCRVDVARKSDATLAPLTPSMTEDMDAPTAIAADPDGNLFVVDEIGGGVVVVGRDGSFRGRQLAMGWKDGMVRFPSGACFAKGTILVIADRGNNRAQVYSVGR